MYRNASRALEIAEVAETLSDFIPNPQAKALALWAKGNPLHLLARNQEALACMQGAESIYAEQGQQLKVAGMQLNQVAVLREMAEYQSALNLYHKARRTCQTIGLPAQRYLAGLEMNIGATYWLMGELTTALEAYERANTLFASLPGGGQEPRMAMIEINQANVLEEMDRFSEAEPLYIRARDVLAQTGYEQEVARADLNLGILAYRRAQYQSALRYLEAARSGFAAIPNPTEVAMVDLYRSFVYRDLNMLSETIRLATDAEQTFEQETNLWFQALALINQAISHQRLHKYAKAEERFAKARLLLQKQGALSRIVALDLDRAYLALQAGRLKAAQELAHEVKVQLDPAIWPSLAARHHLLLARCALASATPDPTVARQHTQQAQAIANTHHLHEVTIAAHHLIGQIFEGCGDLEGAWQAYYSAMEKIEWLRALLALDEFRLGFMEEKLPIYADAVRLSHQMARQTATNDERAALTKVFYTLNLALSAPLRRLRAVEESFMPDNQPLRKQLDALREQWYWHQSKLEKVDQENSSHLRGVRVRGRVNQAASHQRLYKLESQMAELMRRLQVRIMPLLEPQEATPARVATTADGFLATIQARLGPQELLLQYYQVEEQVQALLVTQKEIQLVPDLIAIERIERGRKAWHFDLEHTFPFAASPQAGCEMANRHLYRFYKVLVAPFEPHLTGYDKIFLLMPPDWHDLPVRAFFDRKRYLAQRVQLVYLSTPDTLLNNDAGAGDFVLPAVEMAKTMGETSGEDVSQKSEALVIGYSDEEREPHTLHEARQVTTMLRPYLPITLLLEQEVTLARLQKAALECALLHLASHAVFRPDNPLFSWVRLTDRHLTVAELYDEIRLPQRPLVVLSACETGRGQARGGGLLGMGRGFMAAGANGLIVSLWKAPDQSSARLMHDFYTHLIQDRATPSAALQHAQQQAIARGYHPYHWAGFIFIQG